jgi:hypothetical protein
MNSQVSFQPGSLVAARGREWIVLPQSDGDTLHLRALGAAEDDATLIYLPIEPPAGDAGELPLADASPRLPTMPPGNCCATRCNSSCARRRPVPQLRQHRRRAARLPAGAAADGAEAGHRAPADCRRRRHRQDHRGGAHRPRTDRPWRDRPPDRAVPAPPVRAVAARTATALSHPRRRRAQHHRQPASSATCRPPVGVRGLPPYRGQPRLHQVRAPAREHFQRACPSASSSTRPTPAPSAARVASSATPAQGAGGRHRSAT